MDHGSPSTIAERSIVFIYSYDFQCILNHELSYLFTARKQSLGQGNFFEACVKNSVHGGVYLPRYTPPGTRYTPLRTRCPLDQVHPPEQCMLGDTGNKRAVRILLEWILFICVNANALKSFYAPCLVCHSANF